jgi:hypothetical protein
MTQALKKVNFATAATLDKQEHLTEGLIRVLTSGQCQKVQEKRPSSSFIELMNWTERNFASCLTSGGKAAQVVKFVHNRIIMDGQFVRFCEENNVKIECIYNDSIISWRTEQDYEKFFVQGVFLIRAPGQLNFIHAGLFHKGNQNEDEVSFFNIVPVALHDKYLAFRNQFEDWVKQRDRQNLQIKVVEGEDLPYTKEATWDSLFLPVNLKKDIRGCIETFLISREFYEQAGIPWKRGVLLWGEPGCGKTSLIRTIISNYNFKPVTIAGGAGDSAMREAFNYAESQSPALLYFEELDSMFQTVNISQFLGLMDGVSSKNGLLVVATANNLDVFEDNIRKRPSRFDRKFEVPLPDRMMCMKYLMKWFGAALKPDKAKEISALAFKYKFSYAYLKEFYISSIYEALAHDRKSPTISDINRALDIVMKDKNIGRGRKNIGLGRNSQKD